MSGERKIFEQFRNKFPLNDEKWNEYISYFNVLKVPAKTTLLQEGDIPRKMFLIETGCIRVWFNNNGNDVTTQFFFENKMVSSIESFRKGIPSPVSIETIEPGTLWWIDKNDLDRMIDETIEIPQLRDLFISTISNRMYDYMKLFISSIKDTPLQRYLNLINEQPEIIQRIPQHYIASYLGITPVHLSRIKSRIVKGEI